MGYEDVDDMSDDNEAESLDNCERCGEEALRSLEDCPICGRFLCKTCMNIHSCDEADTPNEEREEDDDDRF
jgi:hypothetical protein